MTMTHEQIDEQMVDFLYGELPANARAAFETHVAGCERCRREVESFGQVRAVARTVLDEAPPARVRDAVMRAAREAAAATPARAVATPAKAAAAGAKVEPARASLWDWLRGRWAFPTLATVGALAVFILGSKLFLNPNTSREIGRPAPVSEPAAGSATSATSAQSKEPRPSVTALEAPAPADVPAPTSAASAPAEARSEARFKSKKHRSEVAPRGVSAQGDGAVAGAFGKAVKDDPLEGLLGSGAGARGKNEYKKAEKRDTQDDPLDGIKGGGIGGPGEDAPLAAAKAPAKKKSASRDVEEMEVDRIRLREELDRSGPIEGGSRAYAPPPPPAVAPKPAYAQPPPQAPAPAANSYAADESDDLAKAAPRREARPMSRVASADKPAPAAEPRPAPVSAHVAKSSRGRAATEESESEASDQAAVHETLVQRADRLFTQGRWAEAAIAYRDLLRQQPSSPAAERWRRRLAAARSAIATDRPPPPSSR
jgi:anti-sigma factor RsiW